MSGLVCAISGETPVEPVVSVKSGNLFEKSLVTKYVQESGTCPVTGDPLSVDDLVPVKASSTVKPRTTAATSLPGLLSVFQNEWDALVLESFELRKVLESTRLELSHALYQHDAACRVIAKLIKERDQARADLASVRFPLLPPLFPRSTAPPEVPPPEVPPPKGSPPRGEAICACAVGPLAKWCVHLAGRRSPCAAGCCPRGRVYGGGR